MKNRFPAALLALACLLAAAPAALRAEPAVFTPANQLSPGKIGRAHV